MSIKRFLSGLLALVLLLGCVPVTVRAAEDIPIDAVHFPDKAFRNYISWNLDADKNGLLSPKEIASVTKIRVSDSKILSLSGIEYFTNLVSLYLCELCNEYGTYLGDENTTSVRELDVSNCKKLETLVCSDNYLISLDVSGCTSLKTLKCDYNQLTSLDVRNCASLEQLDCSDNQLSHLDVSQNSALTKLISGRNPLTRLDVSHNPVLEHLTCYNNSLTSLDVSHNLALKSLSCSSNSLTSLDVSKNTALETLTCNYNPLTRLDLSNNPALTRLSCYKIQLTDLDVSHNTALEELFCSENQLTSLDVSQNTALERLHCSENQLTTLDFSNNPILIELVCSSNQLTSLNISQNSALRYVDCSNNQLTSLDAGNCYRLERLDCQKNQLTKLDLTNCRDIELLYCQENKLTDLDLSDTYCDSVMNTQQRAIAVSSSSTYNLNHLSDSFDVSRTSNWNGGSIKGTILTVDPSSSCVTYTYDCGNYESMEVSLLILRPVKVTASNASSSGKPSLKWDAAGNAAKYQVYRATSKNGKYSLVKTTSSTSYTNTTAKTGRTYYYYVVAVAADGTKSEKSNIVSRTCDLARPTVTLSGISSTGKIKVSWKAIDGAVSYKVYRATSKNGKYTLVKTTTGTSYTNTSAKAGTTYYYKVKAIHEKESANSAYSSYKSRTCDLPRPDVEISLKKGDPRLTWDKIDGAKKYEIYRATSKNGTYKLMKTTTGTSYTNSSAKEGTTYYYKVKAIHSKSAANSAYSTARSIKAK